MSVLNIVVYFSNPAILFQLSAVALDVVNRLDSELKFPIACLSNSGRTLRTIRKRSGRRIAPRVEGIAAAGGHVRPRHLPRRIRIFSSLLEAIADSRRDVEREGNSNAAPWPPPRHYVGAEGRFHIVTTKDGFGSPNGLVQWARTHKSEVKHLWFDLSCYAPRCRCEFVCLRAE